MLPLLSNPPTEQSLSDAREILAQNNSLQEALSAKIATAEEELARLVREAECQITTMREESSALEHLIRHTESYLSPIRRMPHDLLREVFYWCFEDHPVCAWLLAAVNTSWRTLVLSMPRLWSKVRGPYTYFPPQLPALFSPSQYATPSFKLLTYSGRVHCFLQGSFSISCHMPIRPLSILGMWRIHVKPSCSCVSTGAVTCYTQPVSRDRSPLA